jgi:hypothetical protein
MTATTEGEHEFAALLAQVKAEDFSEVLALIADIAAQHTSTKP